ncbi:MAG: hypothetical protein IJR70_03595 [Eubacterium sp.]|nr:hypothetical protein [Eubacterium sp.]
MAFDSNAAMNEYISDNSMTYKKLAEKYGVKYSVIAKQAKENEWVKKRKQRTECEECKANKLSILQKAADKSIQSLYAKLYEEELSINDIKNISTILKTLTAVQRDLYGLPTFKEENSVRLSNERLKLVKAKITSSEDDDKETGVVLIPFLDEEDENEEVVYEGEENV